jgi:hypothetical protein
VKKGSAHDLDFWHRIPEQQRVGVLGSLSIVLLGILYSLSFTGAAGTTVGIEVTGNSNISINLIAIPEKRVRLAGQDNSGTLLTVEVRNPGETSPLFSQNVNTSSGGTYSNLALTLGAGTYDLTAKGYSHLRVKKSNVALIEGATVDFTNNKASPLLCGDVNSTNGDNLVNGIDLTVLVSCISGYTTRCDLNRDSVMNGIDLTNAVSNLYQAGAT